MIPFFTPIRIVMLLALLAVVVCGFVLIPQGTVLPIHWNAVGEADGFAPREVALLLPLGLVVLVWAIFMLVARFSRPEQLEPGRHVTSAAITGLTGIALVIEVLTVLVGLGQPLNVVQAIAFVFGVLLLILGNAMPKSQPNSLAGIRMPTTLRDPANWQATHRLGGVLSIAGGLVLLAAAAFMPKEQLVFWLLACVLVPMLAASAYSLVLARRG